jgi:hypothetical protein
MNTIGCKRYSYGSQTSTNVMFNYVLEFLLGVEVGDVADIFGVSAAWSFCLSFGCTYCPLKC